MKYTQEDVIIWADDPRLKDAIGKECYMASTADAVLIHANKNIGHEILDEIRATANHFGCNEYYSPFLILKKEQKKTKRVPFNLNQKECRDELRDRWIVNPVYGCERKITEFTLNDDELPQWEDNEGATGYELFTHWFFLDGPDAGLPVGKEVEE